MSNACATAEPETAKAMSIHLFAWFLQFAVLVTCVDAQALQEPGTAAPPSPVHRAATVGLFVAGAAVGLAAHEGGHLLLDVAFDAEPGVRRVEFHGLPFFAITHRARLAPGKEFAISSAGFWVQHASNEWLLTRRPRLRQEKAPLAKGLLAFNLLASGAYAGAAFLRTGPPERDTFGMATSADLDERWIGVVVLAPAVFDTWRYLRPESRAAVWLSRAAKVGGALLVFRAAAR